MSIFSEICWTETIMPSLLIWPCKPTTSAWPLFAKITNLPVSFLGSDPGIPDFRLKPFYYRQWPRNDRLFFFSNCIGSGGSPWARMRTLQSLSSWTSHDLLIPDRVLKDGSTPYIMNNRPSEKTFSPFRALFLQSQRHSAHQNRTPTVYQFQPPCIFFSMISFIHSIVLADSHPAVIKYKSVICSS